MVKQLLNSVLAEYRDLSVARMIFSLLATNKSQLFTEVELNSARLFTETRSVDVNILALFTDTKVNNCFSIYHNKTKIIKKQQIYF